MSPSLWTGRVDPARAREHIEDLRQTYGLSYDAIGHLAGLHGGMVEQICMPGHSAYRKWITPATERVILATAFDLDDLLPHHQVDVIGTQRRIRALNRVGWSQGYLASRIGRSVASISLHLKPKSRYVSVSRAREIRDLYQELSMKLGPYSNAAAWAASREWPPPWAWDDETIDNPHTQPDLDCLIRPAKHFSRDTYEDMRWLLKHDPTLTRDQIGERLGLTRDSVSNALIRVADAEVAKAYPNGWHGPLEKEPAERLAAFLAEVSEVREQLRVNAEEWTGRPIPSTFKREAS